MGDTVETTDGGAGPTGALGGRTLKASAVAAALGVKTRSVQGWCAGRAGKSVWPRPCPHTKSPGKNGQIWVNLEEVWSWVKANGLDGGLRAPAGRAAGSEANQSRKSSSAEHRSATASSGETDLFAAAGGPAVMTSMDASREFMVAVRELGEMRRQLTQGVSGVSVKPEKAAELADALESQGARVDVRAVLRAIEEVGLYCGPPIVAADVSTSAINQLMQAIGKAESSARMQQQAHREEQERRGEKIDRETAVRLCVGAGGAARSSLEAAAARAVSGAIEAIEGAGYVLARKVVRRKGGGAEGGSEGEEIELTEVAEDEAKRVLLPPMQGAARGMGEQCAAAFERAAVAIERRAASEGRAA